MIRYRYNFYARAVLIVFLLGVNWLAEIVSMLFKKYAYLLIYLDFSNTFIKELIFVIYICKKDVFVSLKKISLYFNLLSCTKKV